LLSLIVMPRWPWLWLGQLGNYEHFIPILIVPGFLVLAALWRYRDNDARLLLLMAMMPTRWFFDAFVLWLIPNSRPGVFVNGGLQVGSRHLALVSLSAQLCGGGTLGTDLPVSSYACGCAVEGMVEAWSGSSELIHITQVIDGVEESDKKDKYDPDD